MKFNLCKSAVAFLFVVSVLAVSSPVAHASVVLMAREDGIGAFTTLVTSPTPNPFGVSFSGFFGGGSNNDFSLITLAGRSNSPGASPQALENTSTVSIINNTGTTHFVEILFGDTDFTFPTVGTVTLTSSISGTVAVQTAANSITFQTWVDSNNGQNTMTGITSGSLSQDISGVTNGSNWLIPASVVPGFLSNIPFSMTTLVVATLGGHGDVNYSSSAVLTNGSQAAVPEAGSLVIWSLLAGSVGLVVAGRRKLAILQG